MPIYFKSMEKNYLILKRKKNKQVHTTITKHIFRFILFG